MTAVVEERNIFIDRNAEFSESFANPSGSPGDAAAAQLRRWPGGPLLATFTTSVSSDGETVTITLDQAATRGLLRSGYYDVFVSGRVLARGFARLRFNVTFGDSPSIRTTWALLRARGTTWKQLRQRGTRWRDL